MLPQRDFKGTIAVMKSLYRKELYRSILDVQGETIEASLDRYLRTSQQVDARVVVLAERDKKGNLVFAGGLLVERLPHLPPEDFAERVDAEGAWDLKALLLGLAGIPGGDARIAGDIEILGGLDLRFACTCGPERVRAILRATGHDEVQAILQEQGQASVNCHFCNSDYVVPGEELAAMLLDMAQQRPGGDA
jgi:molecular chaperone Hsp33